MLSLLNSYSHGYVAAPVIDSCRRLKIFDALDTETWLQAEELAVRTGVEPGYLRIALHLLQSMGWLEQACDADNDGVDSYRLTGLADPRAVPEGIGILYAVAPAALAESGRHHDVLATWLRKISLQSEHVPAVALVAGPVLAPLLYLLHQHGLGGNSALDVLIHFPDALREAVLDYFVRQGWAIPAHLPGAADGTVANGLALTGLGKHLIERAPVMGIALSYRPMLAQLDAILTGQAKSVFSLDAGGSETHIDRTLNVLASGFQHHRYFHDAEQIVLSLFDNADFASQPRYIADMGCGDGSFLLQLYDAVRNRSQRGPVLENWPLTLIGIDLNDAALQATGRTLGNVPHCLMQGDINDPQRLLRDLQKRGMEPDQVLHVRSFLDHNFAARGDADGAPVPAAGTTGHFPLVPGGVYVDADGGTLAPAELVLRWRAHLARWSTLLNGHGLVVVESHCLDAGWIRRTLAQSENLYFDHLHAYSGQYLIDAELFLVLAANVGLFADPAPRRYPRSLPYCRATLSHFQHRDYLVRHACQDDLPVLSELEEKCWPQALRTPVEALSQRIGLYPQGQFVLVLGGAVVGVIYSQRIASVDSLAGMNAGTVANAHRDDGVLVQLLAVNVQPMLQSRGLGNELLEFMLQRCGVMNGVEGVVGITLCKKFRAHGEQDAEAALRAYIEQRDEQGLSTDPILRFHQQHGAEIGVLAYGYRPRDVQNLGHGVWVHYNLLTRRRSDGKHMAAALAQATKETAVQALPAIPAPASAGASAQGGRAPQALGEFIQLAVSACLGDERASHFAPDRPLVEMGLDSADLLELGEQIRRRYGWRPPVTFFFEHGTPLRIVQALARALPQGLAANPAEHKDQRLEQARELGDGAPAAVSISPDAVRKSHASPAAAHSGDILPERSQDIAIIGSACRLPGGINDVDALWQLLIEGRGAVSELPAGRWQWPEGQGPLQYPGIERGGFLDDIARFDAAFFRISPREAELMDPQQRMLLELTWHALEDAHYSQERLAGSATGVFIGASGSDYQKLLTERRIPAQAHSGLGSSMAILANRISYFYDWNGPSLGIDTACSSSLVALCEAVQSLRNGHCAQALVAGIHLMAHPDNSLAYYQAGMLAPDGQCKPFDQRANGYVRAEGAVAIMLKPLAAALRDGDTIAAVIAGVACNHGGQASGLTVPNPVQQARLLRQAWKDAGIAGARIAYLEAHGTGTPLGDPIEIRGICDALSADAIATGTHAPTGQPACVVGSIKANLGHLEAAAGLAGLLRATLCLQHGECPPQANFETMNPGVLLDGSNLEIARNRILLQASERHYAGISSFGSGGTNAHVVLRQAPARSGDCVDSAPLPTLPALIILSARSDERLQAYAASLLKFVQDAAETGLGAGNFQNEDGQWLIALASTLQRRQPMDARLALTAFTIEELQGKLTAYLSADIASCEGMWHGNLKASQAGRQDASRGAEKPGLSDAMAQWMKSGQAWKAAQPWVKGLSVDWDLLYGERKPRRISAPLYPFAGERYWIAAGQGAAAASAQPGPDGAARLHPLLHRNLSTLEVQRYGSRFNGVERFLSDHAVQGHRVLPGAAHLEMACAALCRASGEPSPVGLRLSNVVWMQPVVVDGSGEQRGAEVGLSLYPQEAGGIAWEIDNASPDATPVLHSQGEAKWLWAADRAGFVPGQAGSLAALQSRLSQPGPGATALYEAFDAMGLHYGPAHRGISRVWTGHGEVLAELRLPACVAAEASAYCLHPSMVDAALQAALLLAPGFQDGTLRQPALPFALAQLDVLAPCTASMWAWVRQAAGAFDIDLFDDAGKPCLQLHGLSSRNLAQEGVAKAKAESEVSMMVVAQHWQDSALAAPAVEAGAAGHRIVMLCGWAEHAAGLRAALAGVDLIETPGGEEGEEAIDASYESAALALLAALQSWERANGTGSLLVQLVVPADGAGQLYAGLHALSQSAQRENGRIHCQLLQLDARAAADGAALRRLLQAEAAQRAQARIRYRDDVRQTRAWREQAAMQDTQPCWRNDGVYLITGGAGGLGLHIAQDLLEQAPQAQLILCGRSQPDSLPSARRESLSQLQQRFAGRVQYQAVDLDDRGATQALVSGIVAGHGRLNGIVHGAGIIADASLRNKTAGQLHRVLAPKVHGMAVLDALTRDLPLDFVLLLSSITGSLGNAGQADYAAANGYLDAFAQWRNGQAAAGMRQGVTLSIGWPLWAEGGMDVDDATRALLETNTGMTPLPSAAGLQVLRQALSQAQTGGGPAHLVVLHGQGAKLRRLLGMSAAVQAETAAAVAATAAATTWDAPELVHRLQAQLGEVVASQLKLRVADLDGDSEFSEYGFDSISLTEFANALNARYGLELMPTAFFAHPTLSRLAAHLAREHGSKLVHALGLDQAPAMPGAPGAPGEQPQAPTPKPRGRTARFAAHGAGPSAAPATAEPIAIIGLSGCFPGAADPDAFWRNLEQGRDCIGEIPASRWDWRALWGDPSQEDGKSNVKWGGFIDGMDQFDPLFFGISPREALRMDPQQRLLMQYAWLCIEDAGYAATNLAGMQGAIFVGTGASGYSSLIERSGMAIEGYNATGMVPSVGPNRMSYFLDWHGPSEPVETACSSSLVAICHAVRSLRSGESDLALAGGVNLMVTPEAHISFGKAGMLSVDGQCRTFSKNANGYVRGEGAGMLLLKRLSDAERDGDRIYGLIRGVAQNHGGRANSLTAPNPTAQADVIVKAWQDAGIDIRTASCIETHGTGTPLGDPIEIDGLKTAFARLGWAGQEEGRPRCALGALKTHIGHLELAAGVAGVIKVLLQMKHRTLIGNLHGGEVNPYLQLDDSPFCLIEENRPWQTGSNAQGEALPRRAGISSFGFGGANSHVVIEEYGSPSATPAARPPAGPTMIILSAADDERLKDYAQKLLAFIENATPGQNGSGGTPSAPDLRDLAYTLQTGRNAMEARLGILAESPEQLRATLLRYLASEHPVAGLYLGHAGRRAERPATVPADAAATRMASILAGQAGHAELLMDWVNGAAVDWSALYPATAARRRPEKIAAPTYPFARERYWIDAIPNPSMRGSRAPGGRSSHGPGRHTASFAAEAFCLQDHVIGRTCVLSAAAQLEMAQQAVRQALRISADADRPAADPLLHTSAAMYLHDVVWSRPLVSPTAAILVDVEIDTEDVMRWCIRTGREQAAGDEQAIYSKGTATVGDPNGDSEHIRLPVLQQRMRMPGPLAAQCYERFDSAGMHYGPLHRGIEWLHTDAQCTEVLGSLRLDQASHADVDGALGHTLHPGLLDSALQICAVLAGLPEAEADAAGGASIAALPLPFALRRLEVLRPFTSRLWAWARPTPGRRLAGQGAQAFDIDVFTSDGRLCARLKEMTFQVARTPLAEMTGAGAPADTHVFQETQSAGGLAFDMRKIEDEQGSLAEMDIRGKLTASAASYLNVDVAKINPAMPLANYGMDSIGLARWADQINKDFRLSLSITDFLEHPSLAGLATHIRGTGLWLLPQASGPDERKAAAAGSPHTTALAPDRSRQDGMDGAAVGVEVLAGSVEDDRGVTVMQRNPGRLPAPLPVSPEPGWTAGQAHPADAAPRPTAQGRQFFEDDLMHLHIKHLEDSIAGLKVINPYFQPHQGINGNRVRIRDREYINFSSYNYLGLSGDPDVSNAAKAAIDQYGTSVSASRVASGEIPLHGDLEREIAGMVGVDACLVFNSGWGTNVTTIGSLCNENDLLLHDAFIHNSTLTGCMLAGGRRMAFPHNDMVALASLLEAHRANYQRVFIFVEGVYSMDGDIVDLPALLQLKEQYQCILMVDEAHSFGVIGKDGRGVSQHFNVDPGRVDIWMGTLSKSLASCGGYIAGSRGLIDYLKYAMPGFVYSAGITPQDTAAALAALRKLRMEPQRVRTASARASYFHRLTSAAGFNTGSSGDAAIVPVILGNSDLAMALSDALFRHGIIVHPIGYPAVEHAAARLRFFISSLHTEEEIVRTVEALSAEFARLSHTRR